MQLLLDRPLAPNTPISTYAPGAKYFAMASTYHATPQRLTRFLLSTSGWNCSLSRAGFTAIAEVYNLTVVRERGNGSANLAVDTIVQCWSILSALKMAQGVDTSVGMLARALDPEARMSPTLLYRQHWHYFDNNSTGRPTTYGPGCVGHKTLFSDGGAVVSSVPYI